jgi:hypothetical protein
MKRKCVAGSASKISAASDKSAHFIRWNYNPANLV